jgi:hypothetical protein
LPGDGQKKGYEETSQQELHSQEMPPKIFVVAVRRRGRAGKIVGKTL